MVHNRGESQRVKLVEIAFTLFWVLSFTFYSCFLVPVFFWQREREQKAINKRNNNQTQNKGNKKLKHPLL
jgi:hypothetical protein